MATKLGTYNKALLALGDGVPLASLSENRVARRTLDLVWDNGVVDYCLEMGLWGFATRSVELIVSNSIVPSFGYKYAYEVPNDFKGLNSIWMDARFESYLDRYVLEAGVIYTDQEKIYLKYVSNSPQYGGNIAKWPDSFGDYVSARMAYEAEPMITNNGSTNQKLSKDQDAARLTALNSDKRGKPKQALPVGNFVRSRFSGYPYNNYNTYNQ